MKQDYLQLADETIGYEVVHRPRVTRRIHLDIDPDGGLLVVAPRRMSRRSINRALQLKAVHVAKFLHQARSRQQDLAALLYTGGERHLFLGEHYPLRVKEQPGRRGGVQRVDGQIQVRVPDQALERVKNALARWYRQQAQDRFDQRLRHFCARAPWTESKLPPMKLRSMKRTWGSCSSSGVITLNPHLIKAPPECIDYVVAHEICHLREHNHGRAFYALQEQLYPQWRQAREWLRKYGHRYLHS